MSISSTTQAALKAGLRTAEQTLTMGLGVIAGGGAILGATNLAAINWKELGGALVFVILTALFAGLKSFLSFQTNGIPAAYTPGVSITAAAPAIVVTNPADDISVPGQMTVSGTGQLNPSVPAVDPAAVDPGIPAAPVAVDPAVVTPAQ